MVWKIRQSVVAALLAMLTATPALAADTNDTLLPLGEALRRMFTPSIPASWMPQLKLLGMVIILAVVVAIGVQAVRILMQHEDKSQAVAEIIQLIALVVVAAIVLFKLLPAIL